MPVTRPARLATLVAVVLLAAGTAAVTPARDDPSTYVVQPEALPAGTTLANPGKGWVVYGNAGGYVAPTGSALDQVVEVADIAYTRFNWSRFYRDDDVKDTLDFRVVDEFFTTWLTADPTKEFAIGVMAENTAECTSDLPATPDWVFDEGVESVLTDLTPLTQAGDEPRGPCRTPVWTDPLFLGEYGAFLVQLRDHLAASTFGLPEGETWLSRVQFVGANSYGNFGEGHTFGLNNQSCGTGARFETLADDSTVCVISAATFEAHMRMFLDVFTPSNTTVMVPWGSSTLDDDGVYDWTVHEGMGLRRDGIFGPVAYTRGRLGDDLVRADGIAPTAYERYETTQESEPTRAEFDRALRTGRPSYFGLGFPAQAAETFERDPALVRSSQRRLGYDFRLDEATLPMVVRSGEPFRPTLRWANDGIAYSYEPIRVGFALLDGDDRVVATSYPSTGANPQRWAPGRSTTEEPTVRFDGIAPGTYRLAVGLSSFRRADQAYALAIRTRPTADGWYPLHDVRVAAAPPSLGPRPVVLETELTDAVTISGAAPGVVARTHVRVRDPRLSSGMGDRFNAEAPGDAISYRMTVATPGQYDVAVRALAGPAGGSYQLSVDGVELGDGADTYAPDPTVRSAVAGSTWLDAGEHTVFLTTTDPNPASSGVDLVLDRITLQPVSAPDLLVNAGFEDGLEPWQVGAAAPAGVSDGSPRSGAAVLDIAPAAGQDSFLTQDAIVAASGTYRASVWTRATGPVASATVAIYRGDQVVAQQDVRVTPGWSETQVDLAAAAGDVLSVAVYVGAGAGPVVLSLDDASLRRVG